LRKPKNINDLPAFLDKIINKPKVLFVDETHEANIEVLEWFRVLVDHVKNLTIVFSALPVFEDILTKNLETLKKRITEKIVLNTLTKEETEELIRKRIESVGGNNLGPFSHNIIDHIYSRTGGFPRDIIMYCNKLLNMAAEKDYHIIDLNLVNETNEKPLENNIKIENIKGMPEKQKLLINVIAEREPISPNEIVSYFEEYPSEKHALRAINNLLNRLRKSGYVEREKQGKTYIYKLSPSTRTILIRA
jgi:DNA-binding transcriptional ArsR family regulator